MCPEGQQIDLGRWWWCGGFWVPGSVTLHWKETAICPILFKPVLPLVATARASHGERGDLCVNQDPKLFRASKVKLNNLSFTEKLAGSQCSLESTDIMGPSTNLISSLLELRQTFLPDAIEIWGLLLLPLKSMEKSTINFNGNRSRLSFTLIECHKFILAEDLALCCYNFIFWRYSARIFFGCSNYYYYNVTWRPQQSLRPHWGRWFAYT